MELKGLFSKTWAVAAFVFYSASAAAVPSLQITDAGGGVCGSYDTTIEDCLVGQQFSVTSLEAGPAYVVFGAVPMIMTDTFTIAPQGDAGSLSLVQSGFGTPPFEDPNSLAPHGIFDTYVEVYAINFDTAGTVFNTTPGSSPPGDSAPGYIEMIDMNLTSLTDGLHIDLFRCSTGSVEGGDCMIMQGTDFAPFSHDATYVPVPAAVWLFGSGLLGLVGIARRRRA